jgi:hypothetical protein
VRAGQQQVRVRERLQALEQMATSSTMNARAYNGMPTPVVTW